MITLNDIQIIATVFPDNTSQVWKLPENAIHADNNIVWEFENEGELMQLAQLQNLILSVQSKAALTMPYLPYARQDKPINNNETFALRSFLSIIRQLGFTTISAFDPHNENVVESTWTISSHSRL